MQLQRRTDTASKEYEELRSRLEAQAASSAEADQKHAADLDAYKEQVSTSSTCQVDRPLFLTHGEELIRLSTTTCTTYQALINRSPSIAYSHGHTRPMRGCDKYVPQFHILR